MVNLIIKSNIREVIKEKVPNISGEVPEALNERIIELLNKAADRAIANGRRTLHARDL